MDRNDRRLQAVVALSVVAALALNVIYRIREHQFSWIGWLGLAVLGVAGGIRIRSAILKRARAKYMVPPIQPQLAGKAIELQQTEAVREYIRKYVEQVQVADLRADREDTFITGATVLVGLALGALQFAVGQPANLTPSAQVRSVTSTTLSTTTAPPAEAPSSRRIISTTSTSTSTTASPTTQTTTATTAPSPYEVLYSNQTAAMQLGHECTTASSIDLDLLKVSATATVEGVDAGYGACASDPTLSLSDKGSAVSSIANPSPAQCQSFIDRQPVNTDVANPQAGTWYCLVTSEANIASMYVERLAADKATLYLKVSAWKPTA